jgi:hypothetical protein
MRYEIELIDGIRTRRQPHRAQAIVHGVGAIQLRLASLWLTAPVCLALTMVPSCVVLTSI